MLGGTKWARTLGGILAAMLSAVAAAQPVSGPLKLESPARGTEYRTLMQGSGFWVDDKGDLVTARHVVDGCRLAMIVWQGLSQAAKVVALSATDDVALLHAAHTSTMPVVLARAGAGDAGQPVLAAGFEALKTLKGSGIFSNGILQARDDAEGMLQLSLQAEQGASGAPVLNHDGLLEGMLVRKTQPQIAMAGQAVLGRIGYVQAVSRDRIQAFLEAQGLHPGISDQPQLSPSQSLAARAASLTQGVFCWE